MAKLAALVTKNPQAQASKLLKESLLESGFRVKFSEKPAVADLVVNRNFGMDYDDRDLDFYEKEGINTLNPVSAQRICRDKWKQRKWLMEMGVCAPATFKRDEWKNETGAEWVLKTQRGMQGRGVSFYRSTEELQKRLQSLSDSRYIIQEKIPFEREIRSCHIADEVFWFEKFGGNLYQGAKARRLEKVDPKFEELARFIQKRLGLRFCAVDFLLADQIYAVDLNCYPGLSLVFREKRALQNLWL